MQFYMYIAVSTVHSKMSCRHCSHLTNVSFVTFLSYCPSDTKLTQLCNILPVPLDTLPIVLPPHHQTDTKLTQVCNILPVPSDTLSIFLPPSSSNWHKTHAGVHLTVPSDTLPTQVYNILPVLSHSPHRCATSYLYPRTHSPLYCPPQCQTETQQTKDYVQPVLPWQTLPGRTWHC